MRLSNDSIPIPSMSLSYADKTVGTILKTGDELNNQNIVGVYIPRFMFGMDPQSGPQEGNETLKTNCIINKGNKNIGSTSVKTRNYVVLPFFIIPNAAVPKFKNGENVVVDLADHDIKSMMVLPYKMNEMVNRKCDQASWYIPAKKKETDEVSLDNIYALQMDSEDKIVTLIMNKANGEKSRYYLTFNGGDGEVILSDDDKRIIKIITKTDTIFAKNQSGSQMKMEKKAIEVLCDDYTLTANNSITMKTNKYSLEASTMNEKADTLTSKIKSRNVEGSEYNIKYTKVKENGISSDSTYTKITMLSPIVGVSGVLTTGGLGFEPPSLGSMPPPSSSSIDKTGVANFGKPSARGLPLAVAQYTITAMKLMATTIDALCGIHRIPPHNVVAVTMMEPTIGSKRVKG